MNDAALLDSLHAALRNPDLAWYTEFHAGESIVAGYLDSLTDPYDDDAITAADTDEPPLDELITAATHEYLDSGMTYDGFSEHVRTTWRNAAAYDWSKLMAEQRSTGEWSSDANRLAVLGVMMQFAPESTCMMIASDILAENAPLSLPALRERINTPDAW